MNSERRNWMHLASGLLLAAAAGTVQADAVDTLREFTRDVKTGRASFMQTVSSPDGVKKKTSSGTFEFARPDRFRFAYAKPFQQQIVADGRKVWLYDVDLNQVTARKQSQVLGSTPAALIAAAPNLRALQADFTLQAAPDKDGLQWVSATPKAKDGQLQAVRVGFKTDGKATELAALEIFDSFGQRSVMTFAKVEVNPALAADSFQFKPPAGVDVVKQ